MLFDEKDLSVFDNPDSRSYFVETNVLILKLMIILCIFPVTIMPEC